MNLNTLPTVNPTRTLSFAMKDGSFTEDARYTFPVWSWTSRKQRVFFVDPVAGTEAVIHGSGTIEVLSAAIKHRAALPPVPAGPAKLTAFQRGKADNILAALSVIREECAHIEARLKDGTVPTQYSLHMAGVEANALNLQAGDLATMIEALRLSFPSPARA